MTIYFYSRTDEYGDFCNFSSHGFELDGRYWRTVEHYFQAQKFAGTEQEAEIHQARTPGDAKGLGRSTKYPLPDDWEDVKDSIMYRAVLRKFETHADIRQRLLGTGDEELVENARGDYYWGCGADGTGQNKLGRILMDVRGKLRDAEIADTNEV
ncbi:NADAR family protein [Rhodopirellula baltica]